jgi:hypothetical protein
MSTENNKLPLKTIQKKAKINEQRAKAKEQKLWNEFSALMSNE